MTEPEITVAEFNPGDPQMTVLVEGELTCAEENVGQQSTADIDGVPSDGG